jgi:hypothetical protein
LYYSLSASPEMLAQIRIHCKRIYSAGTPSPPIFSRAAFCPADAITGALAWVITFVLTIVFAVVYSFVTPAVFAAGAMAKVE